MSHDSERVEETVNIPTNDSNNGYQRIKSGTEPVGSDDKLSLAFKIHFILGLAVSMLCFILWHVTSRNVYRSFGWWIFPPLGFATSLVLHYFVIARKEVGNGALGMAIIANILCLWIWGINPRFPWFIYPLFGCLIIGTWIHYQRYKKDEMETLAWHLYWMLNLMLFLTWLVTTPRGFPWFVYPLLLLSLPLVIYKLRKHQEQRKWMYSGVVLLWLAVIVLFTWGFTSKKFPWFLFPWAGFAAIQAMIYYRYRHQTLPVVIENDLKLDNNSTSSGATHNTTYVVQQPMQGYQQPMQGYQQSTQAYLQPQVYPQPVSNNTQQNTVYLNH